MRRLLLGTFGLLSLAVAIAVGPDPTSKPLAEDAHAVVHGMTISCHGSGQIWGTDEMVSTMAELKSMGVNWVTIHPYAGIRSDGAGRWTIRPIIWNSSFSVTFLLPRIYRSPTRPFSKARIWPLATSRTCTRFSPVSM